MHKDHAWRQAFLGREGRGLEFISAYLAPFHRVSYTALWHSASPGCKPKRSVTRWTC